MAREIQIL